MIILLNGASSSGKSSISKEIQLIFDDLFLGMSIDKFMSMVPSKYQGFGNKAKQMWRWEENYNDQKKITTLNVGPRGKSYILGIYECIKIMAKQTSARDCALQIKTFIEKNQEPKAFKELVKF